MSHPLHHPSNRPLRRLIHHRPHHPHHRLNRPCRQLRPLRRRWHLPLRHRWHRPLRRLSRRPLRRLSRRRWHLPLRHRWYRPPRRQCPPYRPCRTRNRCRNPRRGSLRTGSRATGWLWEEKLSWTVTSPKSRFRGPRVSHGSQCLLFQAPPCRLVENDRRRARPPRCRRMGPPGGQRAWAGCAALRSCRTSICI